MTGELVLHLGQQTLQTALLLAAPVLVVTLTVGLTVAMLQAVTSVRDMTLGMVLKIGSVGVTLLIFGGWMLNHAVNFTAQMFNHMEAIGH